MPVDMVPATSMPENEAPITFKGEDTLGTPEKLNKKNKWKTGRNPTVQETALPTIRAVQSSKKKAMDLQAGTSSVPATRSCKRGKKTKTMDSMPTLHERSKKRSPLVTVAASPEDSVPSMPFALGPRAEANMTPTKTSKTAKSGVNANARKEAKGRQNTRKNVSLGSSPIKLDLNEN
jgi:hypothetical protein